MVVGPPAQLPLASHCWLLQSSILIIHRIIFLTHSIVLHQMNVHQGRVHILVTVEFTSLKLRSSSQNELQLDTASSHGCLSFACRHQCTSECANECLQHCTFVMTVFTTGLHFFHSQNEQQATSNPDLKCWTCSFRSVCQQWKKHDERMMEQENKEKSESHKSQTEHMWLNLKG